MFTETRIVGYLRYLLISPSRLLFSEGGVQPSMRTEGGTMLLREAVSSPLSVPCTQLRLSALPS